MSARYTRIGYAINRLLYGETEGQLYELARGIDQQRLQCFVYGLSEGLLPCNDVVKAARAKLYLLKHCGHFGFAKLLRLAAFLPQDSIEIVYVFLSLTNGYTWLARRLAGVPLPVTSARNRKDIRVLRETMLLPIMVRPFDRSPYNTTTHQPQRSLLSLMA